MGIELEQIIKSPHNRFYEAYNNKRVILNIPYTYLKCPLNKWFDKTNKSCVHTHQTHWHTPLWTRWSIQIPTQFPQYLRRKLQYCTSQSGSNLEGLLCSKLVSKDMNYILIKINQINFVEFFNKLVIKKRNFILNLECYFSLCLIVFPHHATHCMI